MLDRIDIHIEVPRVDFEKSPNKRRGEGSGEIRAKVEKARQKQRERYTNLNNRVRTKADMRVAEVCQFCELDDEGQQLIKAAMTQLQFSAQTCYRILKLARTIVDLARKENIRFTLSYGYGVQKKHYQPSPYSYACRYTETWREKR
ncbi:MAG: ATP-binding protein [Anaerolineae bacterium]|jgi:magnesium chelatase family protein|nr:ATP-binding protein [Anaerolineae bacterium]